MRRTPFAVVVGVVIPLGLHGQDVERAAASITADDIVRRIGVIAHDSMRGRATPSPELDQTAAYLASEFARLGLEPGAGDGEFIQWYPLARTQFDLGTSGVVLQPGQVLRLGRDVVRRSGATGPTGVSGPGVVLTGSDDRGQSLDTRAIRDAVVIVATSSDPRRLVPALIGLRPAALILPAGRAGRMWERRLAQEDRRRLSKGWTTDDTPVVEVLDANLDGFLDRHGIDLAAVRRSGGDLQARLLPRTNLNVTLNGRVERVNAPNVVAILPGSDPRLAAEYVAFSAHMDHVGVGRPIDGDSIYNGADDDASGTMAVVEAAEAYALLNPRPRRSLLFVVVSGEENGLWGSEYFAEFPTVNLDRVVAALNTDMVGRNWADTIVAIGKEHSDLGTTLERVNDAHPELNMTAIDDIWPNERFYFRSDHYNFARKGVPILFFFNGTHADYHRPGDHVEKINGDKTARIVKLVFYLGLEVANAPRRPRWNRESYRQIVEGRP